MTGRQEEAWHPPWNPNFYFLLHCFLDGAFRPESISDSWQPRSLSTAEFRSQERCLISSHLATSPPCRRSPVIAIKFPSTNYLSSRSLTSKSELVRERNSEASTRALDDGNALTEEIMFTILAQFFKEYARVNPKS
ncbi:hypothetical protein TcWFU_001024 [Taenia crassiceps]|uniref:Uncharacterized protein n=1 Tax=Taenia crassiceps TaxID=6207 RepID=A0ABR4QNY6_9CEST